jgi:hypothetical protein
MRRWPNRMIQLCRFHAFAASSGFFLLGALGSALAQGAFYKASEQELISRRLAADPHLTRLALDYVEWCAQLARLAESRKGGQ